MKLLALCIYFWFKLLHHDSVRQLNLSQLTHRLTVPGFGVADRRHQTMGCCSSPRTTAWRRTWFVHISAVEKAGLSDLREGAKVTFDILPHKGRNRRKI